MTAEQAAALQTTIDNHIPFSLSLYRAVCGNDVNIVEEFCEGRIPEPWHSLVRERLDRMALVEYGLSKMCVALMHMQEQLDRIERKLGQ